MAKVTAIDHDTIRALSVPSSVRSLLDLMLAWGVIAGSMWAALALPGFLQIFARSSNT
jgi:hypothetical protein